MVAGALSPLALSHLTLTLSSSICESSPNTSNIKLTILLLDDVVVVIVRVREARERIIKSFSLAFADGLAFLSFI